MNGWTRVILCVSAALAPPAMAEVAPEPTALALQTAREAIGTSYLWGGSDPSAGFDCSGLIQYAYKRAGVSTPRTALEQHQHAIPIEPDELQPGDLVFFNMRGTLDHVGLYVGEARFIHAPSRGKRVSYARLDSPYWQQRLAGAGRLPILPLEGE